MLFELCKHKYIFYLYILHGLIWDINIEKLLLPLISNIHKKKCTQTIFPFYILSVLSWRKKEKPFLLYMNAFQKYKNQEMWYDCQLYSYPPCSNEVDVTSLLYQAIPVHGLIISILTRYSWTYISYYDSYLLLSSKLFNQGL